MDSDDAARGSAAERIRWAPRVRREKLRRLYEGEARGILDANLLDDIGTTIYCRCRDILVVSDAAEGRVACPRCAGVVARERGDEPKQVIECGRCGWKMSWRDFRRSYQHHELYARGMTDAIGEFMRGWERAEKPRDKMTLIDRLIHVWHWETKPDRQKGRPAAVNLIEGSRRQVLAFLDELGAAATPR
jgi:ribosomal protein S27AE